MRPVEVHHDTDSALSKLRVADVADPPARDAIVAARAEPQRCATEVDDNAIGRRERKVAHLETAGDTDDDVGPSGGGNHAEGPYGPLGRAGFDRLGTWPQQECRSDENRQDWLHFVLTFVESTRNNES